MKSTIYAYKNVFNRENPKEFTFSDFINEPHLIFEGFGLHDYEKKLAEIKAIEFKPERNNEKRDYIPAVDISNASVLSIDIDGISDKPAVKEKIINQLKRLNTTFCIKESVSGNIVAFFKYDCSMNDFKFLYYKLYLELVLMLSVNIDFLPEIGRLRYVSLGETFYINEDSETLTETLIVDELPYISTAVKKDGARKVIFGSR